MATATGETGQALTNAVTTVFDSSTDLTNASTVYARNDSSSANAVLLNVEPIHAAGEYVRIEPGDSLPPLHLARVGGQGIKKVTAKAAGGGGGTATLHFAVIAAF